MAHDIPIDDLRARLEGELLVPDDPDYDDRRRVFFKGFDRQPLAVARVAGAADVASVVDAARESGLELAVRSGGHSWAGYGTVDGGLVIDLSRMDAVEIDADGGTAWVETGATAGSTRLPPARGDAPPGSATPDRSASAGSRWPAGSGSWHGRRG